MKNKLSRRSFLIKSSGVVGAFSNISIFVPEVFSASQSNTVKVGYLPIIDSAPLLIAYANGFFRDEGLIDVRPSMVRSWATLSESFLANKFNLTHLLFPITFWMRYKNKVPVKILAWNHTNGSALTVRADSGIKHFHDLGGKQIAVPFWYSMHNMILQMGLKKTGLKPVIQPHHPPLKPDEVNLFILAPPAMAPALAGKKIDGYIVAEPFNALAELKIRAKILRFVGDIWKNHPCCVVVMKEKIISEYPVFTGKIINAITRAQLWINENRSETAQILSREGTRLLPQSKKILDHALNDYDIKTYGETSSHHAIRHPDWKINRIDFQPYPYSSATNTILTEMKRTRVEGDSSFLKTLNSAFVVKDLVDDRFVREAIGNVGGVGKFSNMDISSPWKREEIIDFAL